MQVGSHLLNKDSSRSHSIMQIQVTSREMVAVGDGSEQLVETHGRLSFVDLAGSERLNQSGSHGKGAKETMHINSSLLVLGKVISALSAAEPGRAGHVPYRDSKLTKLLADSLGGSSLAMMIGCVSPSTGAVEESTNTLHYLSAAKRIQNRPVVQLNQGSGTAGVIKALRDELQGLRTQNFQLNQQLVSMSSSGFLPGQASGRITPQVASQGAQQQPGMPMVRTQSVPEQQLQSIQRAEQTIEHMSAELQHVRRQNAHLAMANNLLQRSYADVKRENETLLEKLERLERVFIDRNDQ